MSKEKGLVRLNYFSGMILTAESLEQEQSYFLQKCQRHNRYLHGWGVVYGFTVRVRREMVVIQPGLAIDCAGNEIFLSTKAKYPLPKKGDKLYVNVQYIETKTAPIPHLADILDDDANDPVYSRIQEGCLIELSTEDANSNHEGIGPGTPGCGCQHPVSIACLKREAKGWRVSAMSVLVI